MDAVGSHGRLKNRSRRTAKAAWRRSVRRAPRPAGIRVAVFVAVWVLALAGVIGTRLGGGHSWFSPHASAPAPSDVGLVPAPEPTYGGAGTTPRWLRLRLVAIYPLVDTRALGRPTSIHITFPRTWQALTYEVGGAAAPKAPVRLVCDACPGVSWILHHPEDYSLQEGLLIDTATFGLLEITGGTEHVVEWNF